MAIPLDDDAVKHALLELPGWTREGDRLVRRLKLGDFRAAIGLLVRVAFEAEALNHHPEIHNVYDRVELGLQTHDAGNKITALDVELARRINALLPSST